MNKLDADAVAKGFNLNCPPSWKARPYMKLRAASGVFNAVSFAYRGGMLSLLMDCDEPLGQGFQIKFHNFVGAFNDYTAAIQRAIYTVLSTLKAADLADEVPDSLAVGNIAFSLRKDGSVSYLGIVGELASTLCGLAAPSPELTYEPDEDYSKLSTEIDDLL